MDSPFGFDRDLGIKATDINDVLQAAEDKLSNVDQIEKSLTEEVEKQKRITVIALRLIQQKLEEQLKQIVELEEKVSSLTSANELLKKELEELGVSVVES